MARSVRASTGQQPRGIAARCSRRRFVSGLATSLAAWWAAGPQANSARGVDAGQKGVPRRVVAEGFSRRTVYHSPQTPGYTSWVGAWEMPDRSLMICFTQATGPLKGRSVEPAEWRQKLGIPAGYDFWGLDLREIYLRSKDGGKRWQPAGSTSFQGVGASAYAGGATACLPDGQLLRRVNGWDLMQYPHVPHTAFLQRSGDGARTWGPPQVLFDPARFLYQLSRIRRLRDGRLVGCGQLWRTPADTGRTQLDKVPPELLLVVSKDEGRTWRREDDVVPSDLSDVRWDEWDLAELAGGDLLCVFRRGDPHAPGREARWQGLLRRRGEGWLLEKFRASPFPQSGHPELLAAREGVVLHIATTGVHWTADAGETWRQLEVAGLPRGYRSRYYPRSLQAADGRIYVFSHNGSDNRYGEVDQSIDMDVFELALK